MDQASAQRGTPVCDSDDVAEGLPQRHDVAGRSLIVVRAGGRLQVYANRCPHRGTELDWQPGRFLDAAGRHLQCATHGALFDIDSGRCVAGPCKGQSLERVEFEIQGQRIVIAPA